MPSISWTDTIGAATLTNGKLSPADRFHTWTPSDDSVDAAGPSLRTGRLAGGKFRRDGLVSFELRAITGGSLPLLLRLKLHLMKGGSVALASDNVLAARWATATLAPGTMPQVEFSDRTTLEYTLSVTLREVCMDGLSGIQDWGDSFCRYGPGDYLRYRTDQLTDTRYLTPHAMGESGLIDTRVDEEGLDYSESHSDFEDHIGAGGLRRMLKFERLSTDTAGINWGGQVFLREVNVAGTPVDPPILYDYFQRIVCEFSEGFVFEDDRPSPPFNERMIFLGSEWVTVHTFIDNSYNVTLQWGFGSSTNYGNEDLVATYADFFDGTAKEIIMRVRDLGAQGRIEIWYGDAFGALVKVVDATVPEAGLRGEQFYAWMEGVAMVSVPPSGSKFYGIIEWEGGDATAFANASWFARLGA